MPIRSQFVLYVIAVAMFLPAVSANAQRGSLIEDLFRTVAEAQLQREQQKRLERREPNRRPIPPSRKPDRDAINVRSKEMAAFAGTLSEFSREIGILISDLQPFAGSHPEIRPILPAAYAVSSEAGVLLRACDGKSSLDPIVPAYASLDSQWRSLSFQLRATPGLSDKMMSHVRKCDQAISSMGRQAGVAPQMDRHALHDKMIVAATYMQALLDDVQVSDLPRREAHRFAHDGRLLRQELLRTADEAELIGYEEVVTRFNEFAVHWRSYSDPIRRLGNPHFNQRLDRIAQCGEETYALLWMRPPVSSVDLAASAARLKRTSSQMMDQLTLRALASLDRLERDLVEQGTRAMYTEAKHLDDAIGRGADSAELREHFVEYDRAWVSAREPLSKMRRVDAGLIEAIDRDCQVMRRALGVQSAGPAPIRTDELLGIAASLEGSAEYFKSDIQRYERYLTPAGFRRSIAKGG